MQTHDQYNGVFLTSDSQFAGHLRIAGADSLGKIIGKEPWEFPETEYIDIHGVLSDGKKASLLNCVSHGQTQHRFDKNTQFESEFFPNYIAVGEEFIHSDEPVIRAVRYQFENLASLLSGQKTFRSLHPGPDSIRKLLEEDHKQSAMIAEEHGWPKRSFEPEIGDHPHLLYFSGAWEIISLDTNLGRISLTNRTSYGMGSAAGVGFDNKVTANIEFTEPKTLSAAIQSLYTLHGLFELSLGRRQRYQWIELEISHRIEVDQHDRYQTARLYWSLCNERVENDSKTHPADTLLAPNRRPDEFVKVAAGWMDSAATMGDPRERFATAFFGSYGINRIVGAANMFDLLPESHAPKKKKPDAPLVEAVKHSREIFKALPDSFAKQSVLSALGRVGTASLRDKVFYRADKIISTVGNKLPDLHMPCNHAVLARNHYVHGSQASFDYQAHFAEFAFITDTLEFVFATSDLLDIGWYLKGWLDGGTSMTHDFGAFIVNYTGNIRRLNALIGE